MTKPARYETSEPAPTLDERVGGDAWFEAITEWFYPAVAADPILRPLHPDDLTGAQAIDRPQRDAWYRQHTAGTVKAGDLSADDEQAMLDYFAGTAIQLTNRP